MGLPVTVSVRFPSVSVSLTSGTCICVVVQILKKILQSWLHCSLETWQIFIHIFPQDQERELGSHDLPSVLLISFSHLACASFSLVRAHSPISAQTRHPTCLSLPLALDPPTSYQPQRYYGCLPYPRQTSLNPQAPRRRQLEGRAEMGVGGRGVWEGGARSSARPQARVERRGKTHELKIVFLH